MAKQTFTTGQVLTAAQMTSLQQTAMGGGSPSTKTASYVLVAADAGTVIQMNAAGSTTITVNTALFSAGDSVQIQNIGAGVCTITAGTATVNTAGSLTLSQWEGGFLYFTSASSAIFFDVVQSSGMTNPMTTAGDTIYGGASGTPTRLAIGSTGNVLTVSGGNPVWAAPASGMSFIKSSTFSGASTVEVDTAFSSTYDHYFIILNNTGSTGTDLSMRFRSGGTTNTTASYNTQQLESSGTTTSSSTPGTTSNGIRIGRNTTGRSSSTIWLQNPYASLPTCAQALITQPQTSANSIGFQAGSFTGTDSFDGLQLNPSSGTITGTITIYGLAKS